MIITGKRREAALRAMRDLGVVRASAISPGYRDLYSAASPSVQPHPAAYMIIG